MDKEGIESLKRRQRHLRGLIDGSIVPEEGEELEVAWLRKKVEELEAVLKIIRERHWDSGEIRAKNKLRRAKGKLKETEIAASLGVERVPHAEKVYYDSYQAYVKKRLPNPMYRLCRVFDHDGEILEEDAIVVVHLNLNENFWPRDRIYVEPSGAYRGKWELVGEYNFKGMRIN